MAGALGIEPSSAVLETVILPMYDAPLLRAVDSIPYGRQDVNVFFHAITIFSVSSIRPFLILGSGNPNAYKSVA